MTKYTCTAGLSALLVAAAAGLSSCESTVDGVNIDPNNFTEITLPLALNQAQLNMASIAGADPSYIAAMWTDQLTGTDRQYVSVDQFDVVSNDFDDIWEDLYQRGVVQAQTAKQLARDQGVAPLQGVALVTEAFYFGEAASMFGDVPFTQANQINEFSDPVLDPMGDVLKGAANKLDSAIALVGAAKVATLSANIFASTATWAQVANGFKARYLLGLKDYEGAYAAAKASGMKTAAQDLGVKSSTTNFGENLYWQFEVEQRGGYLTIGDKTRGLSYLQQLLSDTSKVSRKNAKTKDAARYNYFVQAGDNINSGAVRYNVTDGFAAQTAPIRILTSVEVQLILAEAAARTGRRDEARAALNAAREYWDEFLGTEDYTDLDDADLGDDNNFLKTILTEKFLSVIGLPFFYDTNRTNNLIGVPSEGNKPLAKRFLYPQSEIASNSNLPENIAVTQPLPLYR